MLADLISSSTCLTLAGSRAIRLSPSLMDWRTTVYRLAHRVAKSPHRGSRAQKIPDVFSDIGCHHRRPQVSDDSGYCGWFNWAIYPPSARIAQTGRNAVDGQHDDLAQALGLGAFGVGERAQAAQHLDLDIVEGVHVRVPQLDGALNNRIRVHQLVMARDGEDGLARAVVLGANAGED